ncbi:MAG: hypothetical protein D6692_11215 [Planctomycetota bacterium]|nr:MAG: hypothetical protein D6692_11215 [Planctomycetota bacterium]
MKKMLCMLALVAGGTATANPTFLATQGSTLIRYNQGNATVDSFALSAPIVSLTTNPSGQILASSSNEFDPAEFFRLDDPNGTPSLSYLGNSVGDNMFTSLTYVGNQLYGFYDGSQQLWSIDDTTYQGTLLGYIGVNNVTFGGSAYDEATDTFYALGYNLFTLEASVYRIENYSTTPSGVLIGNTGILADGMSLEFYDGVLYAAIQNRTSGAFELGSIDTTTGAFSLIQTLASSFSPSGDPTSLAIIPAPGTGLLIAAGGLLATRRRRG